MLPLVSLLLMFSPVAYRCPAPGVENSVRCLVDAGEILPFEAIRNRVMSQVTGDYVGAEFDTDTLRYRFRFLNDGKVINVDVDARTGQIISRRKSF